MFRSGKASESEAIPMHARVRPLLRQGLSRVGPLDRAATRAVRRRRAFGPLLSMYEDLRRAYAGSRVAPAEIPTAPEIETVNAEALKGGIYTDFFQALCVDGDLDRAAVTTTRKLIAARDTGRARSIAQALQQYGDLRPIADICLALCAVVEPMPAAAWTLFARNDLALVLRWAAEEYFKIGFRQDPATAAASLDRVARGDIPLEADADTWLQIAYFSFSAGWLDLADRVLTPAEAAIDRVGEPARRQRLRARLSNLRGWLERAARAKQPVELPAGEIPFALIGYAHPDLGAVSRDLDDPTETLAVLGHLLRHDGVRLAGDPALVTAAAQVRADMPAGRRISDGASTVRLYEVERDVSQYAAVPDGTWTIVSDWFTHPLAGPYYDMPLNANLRPIFVSFHITPRTLSAPGVIDYLRKYAPIGCRDWDTTFLLHAAGVPAFYSGALAATVDTLFPSVPERPAASTAFVDVTPDGPGERSSRLSPAIRDRDLADNLTAAAATLRGYCYGAARLVTSDARFYLATRALGCTAELRPSDLGDHRAADFVDLSDEDFVAMQRGISDKLAAVLGAVLAGRPEDEVYAAWRGACAADVERVESQLRSFPGHPSLSFDLEEVCKAIRAAAVTVERSEPGPDGSEINIEFSLDGNYKHQLDIVLDSVVERASRPVRAYVLCRGHGQQDFDRMARLFPTVSFVWLPTDAVDFGQIIGLNRWVSAATLDRTTLPLLLPDVQRIIHFDLDALCLADLAELFDTDMEGTALAAAAEPQPSYVGGYDTIRRAVRRMRREGNPNVARAYMIRIFSRHPFDFQIFNAGIMLLDLDKMRADDFCGNYLGYMQQYGVNGQTVICIYVGRDYKMLGGEWNRLIRLEVPDTVKIAHWAGPFKPWGGHQYVSGRAEWRAQEERFAARAQKLVPAPV